MSQSKTPASPKSSDRSGKGPAGGPSHNYKKPSGKFRDPGTPKQS
jgi:hypothetical protein